MVLNPFITILLLHFIVHIKCIYILKQLDGSIYCVTNNSNSTIIWKDPRLKNGVPTKKNFYNLPLNMFPPIESTVLNRLTPILPPIIDERIENFDSKKKSGQKLEQMSITYITDNPIKIFSKIFLGKQDKNISCDKSSMSCDYQVNLFLKEDYLIKYAYYNYYLIHQDKTFEYQLKINKHVDCIRMFVHQCKNCDLTIMINNDLNNQFKAQKTPHWQRVELCSDELLDYNSSLTLITKTTAKRFQFRYWVISLPTIFYSKRRERYVKYFPNGSNWEKNLSCVELPGLNQISWKLTRTTSSSTPMLYYYVSIACFVVLGTIVLTIVFICRRRRLQKQENGRVFGGQAENGQEVWNFDSSSFGYEPIPGAKTHRRNISHQPDTDLKILDVNRVSTASYETVSTEWDINTENQTDDIYYLFSKIVGRIENN